ncbi:hypothetical protein HNR23_003519 [Nocardiopsis mwathae]|uniref:Uncharacterized protein n=1 Tax=Nocardiopsis mwathae TaxID=1472723 RepID=A0A7W9YK09_9ACTN|nr:hypothetical protein [Nocardiopsis mwathae]MBB6173459.1 hypothetical protein [Nocardiopsis mwathae]
MTEDAGGRRRSATGLVVLGTVLAAGCTPPHVDTLPGLAQPVASSTDGVRLESGDQPYAYRNLIHFVLPQGWSSTRSDDCLTPPGDVDALAENCPITALRIVPGAARQGLIDPEGDDLARRDGWERPWTACPDGEVVEGEEPETVTALGRRGFTALSGERVESAAWILSCGGDRFDTRVWYVPEVDLELSVAAITDAGLSDDYDAIARSMDLSRYTD